MKENRIKTKSIVFNSDNRIISIVIYLKIIRREKNILEKTIKKK